MSTFKIGMMGLMCAALSGLSSAQEFHILLRAKDGRTWFHLGEPIKLEAACVDPQTGRYFLPCKVVLKAAPVSNGSRLSADRIDQLTWLDAQSGTLPPEPRGECGNIENQLPLEVSTAPTWQQATVGEPFPVHVGRYRIRAEFAVDLEMAERFGTKARHSSSDEIEIGLDDNLGWKDHLIHFRDCDYDHELTLIPDSDVIATFRKHLAECAVKDDRSFGMLLHEIAWLKMQVEKPDLYSRMVELEHVRLTLRSESEADLQKLEVAQARFNAKTNASLIRKWFHDQYRELLLETAQQLVLIYKSHPELRGDEEFEENLQIGFENWHDAAATLMRGANSYVSREQVTTYLKHAGRSRAYIEQFMKEERPDLPLEFPEYRRYTPSE